MSKGRFFGVQYYFMRSCNKGFTLVELLVVVSIVSLLSSLILVSVTNAKNKAIDNKIKSNLLTVRSQSAIYYEGVGNYDDFLDFQNNPNTIQEQALNNASGAAGAAYYTKSEPGGWYAQVPLKGEPGFGWCVDYLGNSKKVISGDQNLIDPLACP